MHFWEKVRRDLKSWERENFKNTQTFYYWPRNNWENQILPRSELQTPGRPVWPASRAELRCQTNNFFAKQLICSQRILATRQYNKRSQYTPAFFGDLRLRDLSLLGGCKCSAHMVHTLLFIFKPTRNSKNFENLLRGHLSREQCSAPQLNEVQCRPVHL